MNKDSVLDTHDIMKLIPHRHPFLFVDRVIERVLGESVVAVKAVSYGEPFFQGHFPNEAVMPGVLIIEALAQAAALMFQPDNEESTHSFYLVGVQKARFREQVRPGNLVTLVARHQRTRTGGFSWIEAQALVNDNIVAEAELISCMRPT